MIYNVVLVSGVEQSDSYIFVTYISFCRFFPIIGHLFIAHDAAPRESEEGEERALYPRRSPDWGQRKSCYYVGHQDLLAESNLWQEASR